MVSAQMMPPTVPRSTRASAGTPERGSDAVVGGRNHVERHRERRWTVQAHLDAGADHVVVQVLGDGNPAWDPRPALRELAGVLELSGATA
jgi:hypothetical protein